MLGVPTAAADSVRPVLPASRGDTTINTCSASRAHAIVRFRCWMQSPHSALAAAMVRVKSVRVGPIAALTAAVAL